MEKVPFEESCTTLTLLRKAANGTTGQSWEEVTSESKPGRQSARGGRSGRTRTAQISLGHHFAWCPENPIFGASAAPAM